MSDGCFQFGTLLNNFLYLSYLCVAVSQFYAENDVVLFHITKHLKHLVIEELLRQSGSGNFQPTEALLDEVLPFSEESSLTSVRHSEAEETGGVALLNLHQIAVLQSVDKLLSNDSCRNLRIVHVGQKTLSSVLPVRHVGRQHLALLAEEDATATVRLKRVDGLSIHHRIYI